MKTRKIYLGSINCSPTMTYLGSVISIYDRPYSLSELVSQLKEAEVSIENFLDDSEIEDVIKQEGVNLPERTFNKFIAVPEYCTYFKVVYDSNDNLLIHRWDFYPKGDITIKDKLE